MASPKRQMWFWGIAFVVFALTLWALGTTLLPFMLGAAMAYFLDPVADRLEAAGLSRALATAIIALCLIVVFIVTLLLVLPPLVGQTRDLIEAIPSTLTWIQNFVATHVPGISDENSVVQKGIATIREQLSNVSGSIFNSVLTSSLAVFDFVVLLVITPVVTFYLLLDWDRLTAELDGWLPREHADTIRSLFHEIDKVLAGFVRGQVSVCAILGTFYAIALTLVGLPFGFLVGMFAGLISFIPFVGSILGGVLSIGIALSSFWGEWIWIVATAAIFAFGQFFEGNILSPKLVGKSVGLHPVLLILALSVFGKLFGFAGMLIAVPAAASLGVLSRFLGARYRESPFYKGRAAGQSASDGSGPA